MGILSAISNRLDAKALKKYNKITESVLALENEYSALTDEELKSKTDEFKERLKNGESLDSIQPEAFAAVREAAYRTINMKHFPVQITGGAILHDGNIAEMKTGEGKTLVATLPAYLNALTGEGVHIVTVNDYLAARDSEWMGKVHRFLGLSVGLIVHDMTAEEKREAYNSDITYATNNELGFDYLRDNMVISRNELVQRDLAYAVIDEVDSILIDEARTPLIISGSGQTSSDLYKRANSFARSLRQDADFETDEKSKTATLTENGITKAERFFSIDNLADLGNIQIQHHINQALKANFLMKRDVDYVRNDGEIVIVDEFTGRLMPGRRYNDGLHQAIEAKEGVTVARESMTMATITFQNLFRMYSKLSGMTGTAKTEADEFSTIYHMDVISVPTNKPMIRDDHNDVIYKSENGKFAAVIKEIAERHEKGQPVLVGTISIEKSEVLSKLLKRKGIKHNVLNAKQHQKEAEIVAGAGQMNSVTISTNMAGRGTDIILGEGVVELGGLHIIGTERHESRRIDNQLRGRAGRQGDPGSSQFFLSLEDELLRLFGSDRISSMVDRIGLAEDEPIESSLITKTIENAQKNVEGRNFGIRKNLLKYDDIMNKQREVIYAQRRNVLNGSDLKDTITGFIQNIAQELAEKYISFEEVSDPDGLISDVSDIFGTQPEIKADASAEDAAGKILEAAMARYDEREEEVGVSRMRDIERFILLRVVDLKWMDHIDNMVQLRQGVSLQAYAQTDPIQAYTREGLEMFDAMSESIAEETVRQVFHFQLREEVSESQLSRQRPQMQTNKADTSSKPKPAGKEKQMSKNALCWCGSGKKFKRCHGKDIA